jgi:hypothetical protein
MVMMERDEWRVLLKSQIDKYLSVMLLRTDKTKKCHF